ncbi:hypothetical protein Tco_1129264 [Tanacetum coccineum]
MSILVNGSPTEEFRLERGVRQVDPLSSFLFILAAEGLNSIVSEAVEKGIFRGVNIRSNREVVSHLQYANYTIFIGEWNKENTISLMCILKCFEEVSGLRINFNKSKLYGIGVNDDEVIKMSRWMKCGIREFPFTCLVSDDDLKFSKLDRFLLNEEFSNMWGNLYVVALDRKLPDHCPIVIKDVDLNFRPRPFRVFNVWLEEPHIGQVVEGAWNKEVKSRRPYCRFRDKLKNVKEELRKWSKERFGALKEKIEVLKKEVMRWELETENRSLNEKERVDFFFLERQFVATWPLAQKA